MTGTSGYISSLTSDQNNNIYAGSSNGKVYKSDGGNNTFKEIPGTIGSIGSLATDKNGNVYAGGYNGHIYKSNNGTSNFIEAFYSDNIEISKLVIDKDGNLYTINLDINKITNGTSGSGLRSLTVDKNGNIYVGTRTGVYRS